MSAREKIVSSPTEPKKSVRLAQKRKLREEAGTPLSFLEEDYYVNPYQLAKGTSPTPKASSPTKVKAQNSRSSSPSNSGSPPKKISRGKNGLSKSESPTAVVVLTASTFSHFSKSQTTSPKGGKVISPVTAGSVPGVTVSEDSNSSVSNASTPISNSSAAKKKKISKSSVIPSTREEVLEEEKWLDALEAGNIEELDEIDEELKRMKNPSLLTARQRALMEKKDGKDVYAFHIDDEIWEKPKGKLIVTQEMIKLKAEKTEKRRQLAQEKKEIDKIKTVDRLLNKQEAKPMKVSSKPKVQKRIPDLRISLLRRPECSVISFPSGYSLPFQDQFKRTSVPCITLCGVDGCGNPKKYSCSTTQVPLCSLECYRKNLLIQAA